MEGISTELLLHSEFKETVATSSSASLLSDTLNLADVGFYGLMPVASSKLLVLGSF